MIITRLESSTIICPMCGNEVKIDKIISTSQFGFDLDLRPNGPARSLIGVRIHWCNKCNYVFYSYQASKKEKLINGILESKEYLKILEDEKYPMLTRFYLARAYLYLRKSDSLNASKEYLNAAWTLDDCHIDSVDIRKKVIKYMKNHYSKENVLVILDLLRRTGEFDNAKAFAEEYRHIFTNSLHRRIVDYQLELISKKDIFAHSVNEI